MTVPQSPRPPAPPRVRLSLGVTGHREDHEVYARNADRIGVVIAGLFDRIEAVAAQVTPPFGEPLAPVRLHSLLADGTDQVCAGLGLARGWELVAPLPFGLMLNRAINARPATSADARALLEGSAPRDPDVVRRAEAIGDLEARAHVFALADDDAEITPLWLAALDAPQDQAKADAFKADTSARAALAAQVLIEQSDIVIAVWDGARTSMVGGTGHTVAAALDRGGAVVWVDPAEPEGWRILGAPEALTCLRAEGVGGDREDQLDRLVRAALAPGAGGESVGHGHGQDGAVGASALEARNWRGSSNPLWHAYRRVEALFSGERGRNPWRSLRQTYETPDTVGRGSGAGVRAATAALPGVAPTFVDTIERGVMARFAWADGISSQLSDAYRGGMVVNFVLSACAIVGGLAYLPLLGADWKWPFAAFEFVLLCAILAITFIGQKRAWHSRWFETRRAAEYLRHAPLLLALGAARPPGRWPVGAQTSWPEHYARHALREVGLPRVEVTPAYLRQALRELLDTHVTVQRDYHRAKARKLANVHHNLDVVSGAMFQLAVASVAIYLLLAGAQALHLIDHKLLEKSAKVFTFLGAALPTFGGAVAGIRYFGDFERFAAISEITAGKLDAVHDRIRLLLEAPDDAMDYGPVSELAHAADDIVVSEIESWQAVFAGKHITVPV
jgi:hypothetical protein